MNTLSKILLCVAIILIIVGIIAIVYLWILDSTVKKNAIWIAKNKCATYLNEACDSNNPKFKPHSDNVPSRTMGGVEVSDGVLPHMAYITTNKYNCSGTLISEYFILTSAECLRDVKKDEINVILGSANINNGTTFKIEETYINPDFDYKNPKKIPYDTALLKLVKKVEFDWKTRPICLNTDFKSISTTNMTIAGWGEDENRTESVNLRMVETQMDEEVATKCVEKFGATDLSQLLCTGHPTKPKGVCSDDFGGPLQIPLKYGCVNTYEQIGITREATPKCGEAKGQPQLVIHARVHLSVVWIVKTVWKDLLSIS